MYDAQCVYDGELDLDRTFVKVVKVKLLLFSILRSMVTLTFSQRRRNRKVPISFCCLVHASDVKGVTANYAFVAIKTTRQ